MAAEEPGAVLPAADAEDRQGGQVVDDGPAQEPEAVPLTIQKVTAISGGGLRHPWYPCTREVEGRQYLKLLKWDRDLTRFVSGKGMNLSRGRPSNHIGGVRFFTELAELRKEACNQAMVKLVRDSCLEAGQEPPAKVRPATQSDEWLASRTVVVEVPAAGDMAARELRLLWAVRGDVYMELTKDNLEYVREAIRSSAAREPEDPKPRAGRKRKGAEPAHPVDQRESQQQGD